MLESIILIRIALEWIGIDENYEMEVIFGQMLHEKSTMSVHCKIRAAAEAEVAAEAEAGEEPGPVVLAEAPTSSSGEYFKL